MNPHFAIPRGLVVLGSGFGDVTGMIEASLVDPAAAAKDVLAAVDAARVDLGDQERVLFLLGYEACCALDEHAASRTTLDPSLGPAAGAWRLRVRAPLPPVPTSLSSPPGLRLRTTTAARRAHLARVMACGEALLDGVIYQANLAHRLRIDPVDVDAGHAFFCARADAAACAAFVDLPGFGSLISLSPERFVVADLGAGLARTFPIKGTVKRGAANDVDADVARLRASEKDRAEHVMIVDLLRNDMGRVARVGGVSVDSLMHLVSTSSVHHLESTVSARLRNDVGVAELMTALAPGGSITGAPKSSAIDVIAALEDGPRGPYTGVLGLVDRHGHVVTSLLIRTWIRPDDGAGSLHVGGGIVVDSDAEAEWQETLHKAAAFGDVVVED